MYWHVKQEGRAHSWQSRHEKEDERRAVNDEEKKRGETTATEKLGERVLER